MSLVSKVTFGASCLATVGIIIYVNTSQSKER